MNEPTASVDLPLSAADVARYHELGVLRIPEAFPREIALEVREVLWRDAERRFGVDRGDPGSWPVGYWTGFAAVKPVARRVEQPRLTAALTQLFGEGNWRFTSGLGGLLIGAPDPDTPWTLTDRAWHWDGDPRGGATIFSLFNDVAPRGGGTLLVEGSGQLLRQWYDDLSPDPGRKTRSLRSQFLSEHPFLRRLSGRDPVENDPADVSEPFVDDEGRRLCVTEVSGRAGDVIVMHGNLLHARPVHTGREPRFINNRGVDLLGD